MAKAAPARTVATDIMGEVRRRQGHARDILRASSRMQGLTAVDRALTSRLVLGCIGALGLVDEALNAYLRHPKDLEPRVRDALRVSCFELLFLETPTPVAVSEGVELVRAVRPRAAGLANAVLRKVATIDRPRRLKALQRLEVDTEATEFAVENLSRVSGYPAWLLDRVHEERGAKVARDFALSALGPAPIWVSPNNYRMQDEDACVALRAAGLAPEPLEGTEGFYLREPAGLATSGLVASADVIVADLAAQLVARRVAVLSRGTLLEIGQGRGTKTLLIANAARKAGKELRIVGVDDEPYKVKVAAERLERAGLRSQVTCVCADARVLGTPDEPTRVAGTFDTVFLDAPCSGTGTLRRHPEIAWTRTKDDVTALTMLQLELITAAARKVKPGGTLAYATCSVLSEENEELVAGFLETLGGRGFELCDEGLRTSPAPNGPDGHFLALLRRR